jgi:hypothetical protein
MLKEIKGKFDILLHPSGILFENTGLYNEQVKIKNFSSIKHYIMFPILITDIHVVPPTNGMMFEDHGDIQLINHDGKVLFSTSIMASVNEYICSCLGSERKKFIDIALSKQDISFSIQHSNGKYPDDHMVEIWTYRQRGQGKLEWK